MLNQLRKQSKLSVFILMIMLFAYLSTFAQDIPETYVVQRGTVQNIFAFSGTWLPRDQQVLFFDIPGTIQSVNVQQNSTVSAGTVLVDYGIADLQSQLDRAQSSLLAAQESQVIEDNAGGILDAQVQLAGARLGLQQTYDAIPFTGINAAQLGLQSAKDALETAERNYNNVIGDPTNSPGAIDGAYEGLRAAQKALQGAQNSYWGAAQSFNLYDYSIIGAENNLLITELSYQATLQQIGSSEIDETIQDLQTQVDDLTAQIAQSSLIAPFDGEVLEVNVIRGDRVEAFQDVITLALPEPLEIFADLSQEDYQRLDVGMLGICQASGQPETAVQCIVRQLPPTNGSVSVRIAASFDNVIRGQLINVSIPIGAQDNVLWLPPQAIRTFQSRAFVVVQTSDGEDVVDITIGLRTDDRVEILSGLNEGDIVIAPES